MPEAPKFLDHFADREHVARTFYRACHFNPGAEQGTEIVADLKRWEPWLKPMLDAHPREAVYCATFYMVEWTNRSPAGRTK